MSLQGAEELNASLKLISNWMDERLKTGMELSQNKIVTSAKADHLRASSLTRAQIKEHDEDRYYTHTAKLTGSIKAEAVHATLTGITAEVTASEEYATSVELGGPNKRAFPFMGPALDDNEQAIINILVNHVRMVIK